MMRHETPRRRAGLRARRLSRRASRIRPARDRTRASCRPPTRLDAGARRRAVRRGGGGRHRRRGWTRRLDATGLRDRTPTLQHDVTDIDGIVGQHVSLPPRGSSSGREGVTDRHRRPLRGRCRGGRGDPAARRGPGRHGDVRVRLGGAAASACRSACSRRCRTAHRTARSPTGMRRVTACRCSAAGPGPRRLRRSSAPRGVSPPVGRSRRPQHEAPPITATDFATTASLPMNHSEGEEAGCR